MARPEAEVEPQGRILPNGVETEDLRGVLVIDGPRGDRDQYEAASKPPSSRTVGEPNVNCSLQDRCLMSVVLTQNLASQETG